MLSAEATRFRCLIGRALRPPGGAAAVEDQRDVVRARLRGGAPGLARGGAGKLQLAGRFERGLDQGKLRAGRPRGAGRRGPLGRDDQRAGGDVLEVEPEFGFGEARIERRGRGGERGAQDRDDRRWPLRQDDGHAIPALDAQRRQRVGHVVHAGSEHAVAQLRTVGHHQCGIRGRGRFEQRHERRRGSGRARSAGKRRRRSGAGWARARFS